MSAGSKLTFYLYGLLGVTTNITNTPPKTLLMHYRGLWQIEESFRINKHDLKTRRSIIKKSNSKLINELCCIPVNIRLTRCKIKDFTVAGSRRCGTSTCSRYSAATSTLYYRRPAACPRDP